MTTVAWESVKDHGAVGDGNTDDTAAVAAAFAAAHAASAPRAVYFPAGRYSVTSFPAGNDYDVVIGDGSDLSTIIYGGSGTLLTLTNNQRVSFKNLSFWIAHLGKGIRLSNCFNCSFDSVVVRGSHTGGNYPTYVNTTLNHIYIDGSANDWWLTNVWFEGASTAVQVGVAGVGGPSQFGMLNCKVAARQYGVDLQFYSQRRGCWWRSQPDHWPR